MSESADFKYFQKKKRIRIPPPWTISKQRPNIKGDLPLVNGIQFEENGSQKVEDDESVIEFDSGPYPLEDHRKLFSYKLTNKTSSAVVDIMPFLPAGWEV